MAILNSPGSGRLSTNILKETDRELLVRHIMARETEQLRSQRTENDD